MDRRRQSRQSKTKHHSPLDFSDEEEESEGDDPLATNTNGTKSRGGGRTPTKGDYDSEDSEEEQRGRRGMPHLYGGGAGPSYLPTAYGGGGHPPGGPEAALGQPSNRERSVDRIRARSRDRRRDISKERGGGAGRRDRSRSISQSREKEKANQRAAQRRRNRRSTLEQSLGAMSMNDSASSFDCHSMSSSTSDALLVSGVNGMDSSISSHANTGSSSRRLRRTQSRDSTSTDYTADRRRQTPQKQKTWDGRLDDVLNRRRRGSNSNSKPTGRSLSPSDTGGEKRRRPKN